MILVMLITINSCSATLANRLNIVFVVFKTLTISTVIIGGLVRLGQGLSSTVIEHLRDSSVQDIGRTFKTVLQVKRPVHGGETRDWRLM